MTNKYKLIERTPKEFMCGIAACPSIYEVTPKSMICGLAGVCSGIYKDEGNYLIIGKQVNPKEFGLEKKVGEGEVLIKVPKKLIDEKEN